MDSKVTQQQYYDLQESYHAESTYTQFQQVIPNLYIGGQISSLNFQKLKEHNVKRVLKVNGVESFMTFPIIKVKVLSIDDMPDFDLTPYIEEAHSFIREGIVKQEGVLVVCTAGISRSAAIVISYLMRFEGLNYEQAFHKVKQARKYIKPNDGFVKFLQSYQTSLKQSCDLCLLEPKTDRFPQYSSPKFQVLLCDQCDQPMIVYQDCHKQELSGDEYKEAAMIAEQIGNDYYGRENWGIDNRQLTIKDHFHWHVRPKRGLPISIRVKKNYIQRIQEDKVKLDSVKDKSEELIQKHIKTSKYQVLDKQVQMMNEQISIDKDMEFSLQSDLRLQTYDNLVSIHQTLRYNGQIIARIILRIRTQRDSQSLLAKL